MKHRALKRLLSAMLALGLLASALPLTALADYWEPEPAEYTVTGYDYYYTGTKLTPGNYGNSANDTVYIRDWDGTGVRPATEIFKYQLGELIDDGRGNVSDNADWRLFAYCSDLFIAPRPYFSTEADRDKLRYQRIALESVTADPDAKQPFFPDNVTQRAQRLRAIILNSDLWLCGTDGYDPASAQAQAGLATMRAGLEGFLTGVQAGTVDLGALVAKGVLTAEQRGTIENHVARMSTSAARMTLSDAVAATQLAIWHVVNDATPQSYGSSAWSSAYVQMYYFYLISLEGATAEHLAKIEIHEIDKQLTESGTYNAKVYYVIDGEGVKPGTAPAAVSASAKDNSGNTIAQKAQADQSSDAYFVQGVETDKDGDTRYYLQFYNIPLSARLTLTLTGTQTGVDSVYLFTTQERVSQVLVSVMADDVELKTTATIDGPNNLYGFDIYKGWSQGGSLLPSAYVQDYESYFRISYYDPAGSLMNLTRVTADKVIRGNGGAFTGAVFQLSEPDKGIDQLYKIEELGYKKPGQDEVVFADDPSLYADEIALNTRYFRMVKVGGQAVPQWTDAGGAPLGAEAPASPDWFINSEAVSAGSVLITKTVLAGGQPIVLENGNTATAIEGLSAPEADIASFLNGARKAQFSIQVKYRVAGTGEFVPCAGAQYTYTLGGESFTGQTDSNGLVGITQDVPVTLVNIPLTWELEISEITDGLDPWQVVGDSRHTVTPGEGLQTVAFTNNYPLGQLTVTKAMAQGSDLQWGDLGRAITFTVSGSNGYSATVTLSQGSPAKTLSVPAGTYTVTEVLSDRSGIAGANVTHYALTVTDGGGTTLTGGEMTGVTVPGGGAAQADFVNSYARKSGGIKIEKDYIDDFNTGERTFTFQVWDVTADAPAMHYDADGRYVPVGDITIALAPRTSGSSAPASPASVTVDGLLPGQYAVRELIPTGLNVPGKAVFTVTGQTVGAGTQYIQLSAATVGDGQTMTFRFVNSITEEMGKLSVKKVFDLDDGGSYDDMTVTVTVAGTSDAGTAVSKTLTLNKGNGWQALNEPVPVGTYTVTEAVSGTLSGYTAGAIGWSYGGQSGSGVTTGSLAIGKAGGTLTFTNSYSRDTGSVQFAKEFTGRATAGEKATFKVTYSTVGTKVEYSTNSGASWAALASGGSITLTNGQTAVIRGLPTGTAVTVTENSMTHYTTTVNGASGRAATLTVGGAVDSATFVNARKTMDIETEKTVTGTTPSGSAFDWTANLGGAAVTFTITGPSGWFDGLTVDPVYQFTPATGSTTTASFVLTPGNPRLTLTGVPQGDYKVTETVRPEAPSGYSAATYINGSTTAKTGSLEASISAGKTKASFDNRYTWKVGVVDITKKSGDKYAGAYEYQLKIHVSTSDLTGISVTYDGQALAAGWADDNGGKAFTQWVAVGKSLKLHGVPDGVKVTVTELKYRPAGSTGDGLDIGGLFQAPAFAVDGKSATTGTATVSGSHTIALTNKVRVDGQLAVKKLVVGDYTSATDTFTVKVDLYVDGKVVETRTKSDLKHGETWTLTNLPVGAAYVVSEVLASGSAYTLDRVTVTGDGIAVSGLTAAGTVVSATGQTATFENRCQTGTGALIITKQVGAGQADQKTWSDFSGFDFTIQGPSAWTTLTEAQAARLTAVAGAPGKYSFTLTAASPSLALEGLPVGQYTVTELSAAPGAGDPYSYKLEVVQGGRTTTNSALTVSYPADAGEIVFRNIYTLKQSSLTVTKSLRFDGKGSWEAAPDLSQDVKTYTFTLYEKIGPGDWAPSTRVGTDGQFTIEVGAGLSGTRALSGLRQTGAQYFIAEHDGAVPAIGGYAFDASATFGGTVQIVPLSAVTGAGVDIDAVLAGYKSAVLTLGTGSTAAALTNVYTRDSGSYTFEKRLLFGGAAVADLTDLGDLKDYQFGFTLYAGTDASGTVVAQFTWSHSGGYRFNSGLSGILSVDREGKLALSLPAGQYYLAETLPENPLLGKYTRAAGDTALSFAITAGGTGSGSLDNDYSRPTGTLTVSKSVAASKGAPAQWRYLFQLYEVADETRTAVGQPVALYSDSEGIKLSHTFEGLPQGSYVVKELRPNTGDDLNGTPVPADYTMAVYAGGSPLTGDSTGWSQAAVQVLSGQDTAVAFENRFNLVAATVSLKKVVTGASPEAVQDTVFTFEIRRTDDLTWWNKADIAGDYASVSYNDQTGVLTLGLKATLESSDGVVLQLPKGGYELREVTDALDAVDGYTYLTHSFMGSGLEAGADGWKAFTAADTSLAFTCRNQYTKDGAVAVIEKTVSGYDTGASFIFEVFYLDNGVETPVYPDITTPGSYILIPAGYTGQLSELGTMPLSRGGVIELKDGEKAMITGLDLGRTLMVREVLSDGSTFAVSPVVAAETAYYQYPAGGGLLEKVSGAPGPAIAPQPYESNPKSGTGVTYDTGARQIDGGISHFPGVHLTFTNTRKVGGLSITKTVAGPAAEPDSANAERFDLYVRLLDSGAGIDLGASPIAGITVDGGQPALDSAGRIKLSLAHGQTALIEGIPAGLSYSIHEDVPMATDPAGSAAQIYSMALSGDITAAIAGGALRQAAVTNTRLTDNVKVVKQVVTYSTEERDEAFAVSVDFDLTGTGWTEASMEGYFLMGLNGDQAIDPVRTYADGHMTLTFKLQGGQAAVISNVPAGLTGTVTEHMTAEQAGRYSQPIKTFDLFAYPPYDSQGGKETLHGAVTINNYDVPKGSLVITKDVEAYRNSSLYDPSRENSLFDFDLTLYTASRLDMFGYYEEREAEQLTQVDRALNGYTDESGAAVPGVLAELEAVLAEIEALGCGPEGYTDSYLAACGLLASYGLTDTAGGEALTAEALAEALRVGPLEGGALTLTEAGRMAWAQYLETAADSPEALEALLFIPCTDSCDNGQTPVLAPCDLCHQCAGASETLEACGTCGGSKTVGEGDSAVPCELCDENGMVSVSVPCAQCEAGVPARADCTCDNGVAATGETADCETCSGIGKLPNEATYAAAAATLMADLEAATGEFEAINGLADGLTAVRACADLSARLEALTARRDAILAVKDALTNGFNYITFDPDTFEILDTDMEKDNTLLPAIDLKQVSIVSPLGAVDAAQRFFIHEGEDGATYSFRLGHGEILVLSGLPAGARYRITERLHGGLTGEAQTLVDFRVNGESWSALWSSQEGGEPGAIDGRIPSQAAEGQEAEEAGATTVINVRNHFGHPTGRITVIKAWPNGSGDVTEITVELRRGDGQVVGSAVLNADNEWRHTFSGLELDTGEEYTVYEYPVAGFTADYSGAVNLTYGATEGTITVTNRITTTPGEEDGGGETPETPTTPTTPTTPNTPTTPTGPDPEPEEPIEIETPTVAMPPEEIKIPEEEALEVDTPTGSLPNTGGLSGSALLSLFGSTLTGLGALLGRKKKDK